MLTTGQIEKINKLIVALKNELTGLIGYGMINNDALTIQNLREASQLLVKLGGIINSLDVPSIAKPVPNGKK